MRPISFEGAAKVADLIDRGLKLDEIVDQYGRAVHKDAEAFCACHKQAKRMWLKAAMLNPNVIAKMRVLDPTN